MKMDIRKKKLISNNGFLGIVSVKGWARLSLPHRKT